MAHSRLVRTIYEMRISPVFTASHVNDQGGISPPEIDDRSTIDQSLPCDARTTSMEVSAGTWAGCRWWLYGAVASQVPQACRDPKRRSRFEPLAVLSGVYFH